MKNIFALFCLMLSTLTVYADNVEDTEDTISQCTIQLTRANAIDVAANKPGITLGEVSVIDHMNNQSIQVTIRDYCQGIEDSDYFEDYGTNGVAPLFKWKKSQK